MRLAKEPMHRKHLLESLATYRVSPLITEEELEDYEKLIEFINTNPECFERENAGHITGSVWLVNDEMTHVLLTHHKKLGMWIQLGGHADGDPDIQSVAMKEAQEESGITGLTFAHEGIFDIDIHPIPNKCLFHYDVRYLIQAPPGATYTVSHESHDLAWVSLVKLSEYTKAPSVTRMAQKMVRLH